MTTKVFRHGQIVTPQELFSDYVFVIKGNMVIFIGPENELDYEKLHAENEELIEYNLAGDILIPGLIDTHVHGAGGADIMDASHSELNLLKKVLLREGTTAFLGATMSEKPKNMTKLFRLANEHILRNHAADQQSSAQLSKGQAGAEFLGLHLEGPFISENYLGAQSYASLSQKQKADDLIDLELLIKKYPELIRIITFAIDDDDLDKLLNLCSDNRIIPSAGHTKASFELMQKAIRLGLSHVTHLFNAMPGIHHRDPGIVVAGLLDPKVKVEVIADGTHIHPAVLKLIINLKGPDSIILISDGMRAVGMPEGVYELGGQPVRVKNGAANLENGVMAGSAKALLHGIRVLIKELQVPAVEAVAYATINPARLLGVENRMGSLEIGKEATFLRLSSSFDLKEVWQRGNLVSEA